VLWSAVQPKRICEPGIPSGGEYTPQSSNPKAVALASLSPAIAILSKLEISRKKIAPHSGFLKVQDYKPLVQISVATPIVERFDRAPPILRITALWGGTFWVRALLGARKN
jgi:hypothetical protein